MSEIVQRVVLDTQKIVTVKLRKALDRDLPPCDFVLFPRMKIKMKNYRLSRDEDLLKAWKNEYDIIPNDSSNNFYNKHYNSWKYFNKTLSFYLLRDVNLFSRFIINWFKML